MQNRLKGWFAVDRKSIDHPFFKRSERSEYEAWIWLLAHAAWEETHHWVQGKRYDVKRGELFTTLRELQSAWMWSSDKRVRGFLKRLNDERMIDAETSRGKTQITICNYSLYQDLGRNKDAETSEKSPNEGRAKDALKEQTKQNKQEKNIIKKDFEEGFNQLLEAYPVNASKFNEAQEHYELAISSGVPHEQIIFSALQVRNTHFAKDTASRKFTLSLNKWLLQRNYENDRKAWERSKQPKQQRSEVSQPKPVLPKNHFLNKISGGQVQ